MNKLTLEVCTMAFIGSLVTCLVGGWVGMHTNNLALTLAVVFALLAVTLTFTIRWLIRGSLELGMPLTKPTYEQWRLMAIVAIWGCGSFALTALAYAWTGSRIAEGAVAFIFGPLGVALAMRLPTAPRPSPTRQMAVQLRTSSFLFAAIGIGYGGVLLARLLLLHRSSDPSAENLLIAGYFTAIPLSLVVAYLSWKRSRAALSATEATR